MVSTEQFVVGIDGSDESSRAVVWAARAAAQRNLGLKLVAAVEVPAAYYAEPYIALDHRSELVQIGTARLSSAEVLARRVIEDLPDADLEIETEMVEGNPAEHLLEAAKGARMMVVGARGHSELTELVVGSVAKAVVMHAECPVVVVRGRSLDGYPPSEGPVVVGVDGSPTSQAATAVAFEEASLRGAQLIAVHVWSDVSVVPGFGALVEDPNWRQVQEREEIVLAERLAGFSERYPDVSVRRVIGRDRPVRVLSEYSEQAQLIVVGTRGRGGFTGMLMGSVSTALIHTADCPVLVARTV
ncbi:MAG TPA: universal stress protein [Aldersonia sp.]